MELNAITHTFEIFSFWSCNGVGGVCQVDKCRKELNAVKSGITKDLTIITWGSTFGSPILDTRSTVLLFLCMYVTLRVPPLNSETGWPGDFWLKTC